MNLVLDHSTLVIVNGIIVLVCGVAFLLETIMRRSDEVGRLWSMFFIGMTFAMFAYVVGSAQPGAWWAFAVGNGAFVGSLGLVWAGARRANKRRSPVLAAVATAVVVAAVGLVQGPGQGFLTGAIPLFVGAALFCGLSAVEFARGLLARLPSARVLAAGLALMTVYYFTRSVGFVILGPGDPLWNLFYGPATATLIEIALAALGAMMLSSMQADRFRESAVNADFGVGVNIDGILASADFRAQAESWLVRSIRSRTPLVLLLVDLADLSEVNVAFGRAAGDAAIRLTGRVALAHAPTASLVGRLSGGRFALLMELPTGTSVEAIADRIGDSVLSTPVDEKDRFRASTFAGSASTRTSGARFDDLYRAAADELSVARETAHALAAEDEDAFERPEPNLSKN